MNRRRLLMPTVPVVVKDPGGVKRDMPDEEPEPPPPVAPLALAKSFDLKKAKERDAASPWRRGGDAPRLQLPTYEEWKKKRENPKV